MRVGGGGVTRDGRVRDEGGSKERKVMKRGEY